MPSTLRMAISDAVEAQLDLELSLLPSFAKAQERKISPMLPRDFILAGNYIKSFPQHGFLVHNKIQDDEQYLLSPTCCYPVFFDLMDSKNDSNFLITHKNLCFRCEEFYQSGMRQISYLMREYIFFSEDLETVNNWVESVKYEVAGMLNGLGLNTEVKVATDPFFDSNDYKEKFQREQNLKHEFEINGVACGSVNLHLKAFSRSCNITSHKGNNHYSACFGLGYDRVHEQLTIAQKNIPSREHLRTGEFQDV